MKKIKLSLFQNRGTQQIAISFGYDYEIRMHLKKLPEVKWSQTHKTFYNPLTSKNKQELYQHLRVKKWFIDYDEIITVKKHTVNTYVEVTSFFIRYCLLKNTIDYSVRLIESINYDFIVRKNKSISYQNQCINGIKKQLQ